MFTTKSEPSFLKELRSVQNASIVDRDMELIPFLKEQYHYEQARYPTHKMFEKHYKLTYFEATHMLNYYMCTYGDGNKEQYKVVYDFPTHLYDLVYKQTLN